jgi:CspA family cold shock protein
MTIGIVKFFDAAKGYGFIVPGGGGKDIFVDAGAVALAGICPLTAGQHLSFETEVDLKGAIKAVQLKPHANPAPTSHIEEPILRNAARRKPNGRDPRSASVTAMAVPDGPERTPKVSHTHSAWQQSYDRYCDLARGAADDRVSQENYWQHAEHYLRMMNGSAI